MVERVELLQMLVLDCFLLAVVAVAVVPLLFTQVVTQVVVDLVVTQVVAVAVARMDLAVAVAVAAVVGPVTLVAGLVVMEEMEQYLYTIKL